MGTRIELAMKAKGLNQTALSEIMQVTPQAVQKWVKVGSTGPKGSRLSKLASVLGVSVDWLVTGANAGHEMTAQQRPATDQQKNNNLNTLGESNVKSVREYPGLVPLISRVQAGTWCEAIDNFLPGEAERWLICPVPHGSRTYALTVSGDSMTSPFPGMRSYTEGMIIFVDPDVEATSGKRVIAKLPNSNEATFKEYRVVDGRHYLAPLNPRYDMIEINEDVHICGVVVFAGMDE